MTVQERQYWAGVVLSGATWMGFSNRRIERDLTDIAEAISHGMSAERPTLESNMHYVEVRHLLWRWIKQGERNRQ